MVFLRNTKLAGVYVVGDTAIITVPVKTVECGVFTLLVCYYVFDTEYPRMYAMPLAVLQSLVMEDPYKHATSKGYAFLVKRLKEALEKTPETSEEEQEQKQEQEGKPPKKKQQLAKPGSSQ